MSFCNSNSQSSPFIPGDIVRIVDNGTIPARYHDFIGKHAEVLTPLLILDGYLDLMHYCITRDGHRFCATPAILRKVPPPPNGEELCHLTDIPDEVMA